MSEIAQIGKGKETVEVLAPIFCMTRCLDVLFKVDLVLSDDTRLQ